MRLATVIRDGTSCAALVRDGERVLPLAPHGIEPWTVRGIAADGAGALEQVQAWADAQPQAAWLPLADVTLGPAVPDPGAIYTIGHNYLAPGGARGAGDAPKRPLVYGKAASSVGAPGATLRWNRSLTDNVDAEAELGVVIDSPRLADSISATLDRDLAHSAYEVVLKDNKVEWVERTDQGEVHYDKEPRTGFWKRLGVSFMSILPIEWLL